MLRINGRNICENCFEETTSHKCPCCGYDRENSANDPTMLAPGSTLLGKYIIGGVIGKGGFGITYLAYDIKNNKKAAVKEYFPYNIARRSAGSTVVSVSSENNKETFELGAEKFYEEAKLVSQFNGNPNIVEVYEFFYENDTVYLAMEYLHGCTLKEYIRDHGVISAPQALYIANSVSNALSAAHGASVLHRDISPDNIIICSNGDVKLIDFGAARQVIAEYSQSFSVILKHGFAPLEQYNSKGNQGPWTDIYSLGATLYFALTGDIPEDPMVRFENDDTFGENQFGIDAALWAVISKATDMKAQNRYKDAHEMQEALNKIGFKPEPIVISVRKSAEYRSNTNITAQNYKQHISFSAERNDESFFSRHKSVIISVCVLAAVFAAVIIPSALNRDDPNDVISAYVPESDSSDISESTGITSSMLTKDDDSAAGTVVPQYISPSINDYKAKAIYNTLEDKYKPLYEIIYNGIENTEIKIEIPDREYTSDEVHEVYFKVLYDNPQFCYAQDYSSAYWDTNNNEYTDGDEYIVSVMPYYCDVNNSKAEEYMAGVLELCDINGDTVNNLCIVHDMIITYTEILERYKNATCTSAQGAIVNGRADDMGFAKAFCYYAQALGLPCYVVEGRLGEELRAWCKVKLDGTWYNVDVYGDKLAGSAVTEAEVDNSKNRSFCTFFLTNDEYMEKCGYSPKSGYDALRSGEYAANSSEINYYIQRDEQNAFYIEPDDAYDFLLEESAKNYSEGTDKTSCYFPPLEADELYKKLNDQYLSDLEEKYGITPSEFTVKYYPDEFVIVLS